MAKFIRTRGRIRSFYGQHEVACNRTLNGILSFIVLAVIVRDFGFAKVISHIWLVPVLSLLCAFLPASGAAILIQVYLLIQLMSLSFGVAMTLLVMLVLSYAIVFTYQARSVNHLVGVTAAQRLHLPYVISMQTALLGSMQEITTVVCGSVISFYLKEVYDNASLLNGTKDALGATNLLQEYVIANPLFYLYVVAMAALFVVVYAVRSMNIRQAWLVAVTSGVVVEFILMLAGYLFMGAKGRIPELILANLVTFIVGVLTNYIALDLDYTRIERVQFEDDEYYYYVTAVPKIHIEQEEKKVKKLS